AKSIKHHKCGSSSLALSPSHDPSPYTADSDLPLFSRSSRRHSEPASSGPCADEKDTVCYGDRGSDTAGSDRVTGRGEKKEAPRSSSSQWQSAVHLRPRCGSRSHTSGWTRGPFFPVPQPPHPPPHGDRLHGNSLHACNGTGQQQHVWSEAVPNPISARRCQPPCEPDFVPRGVRLSLFKSRLFLFLQRSLTSAPGRGHGRVIAD
ncbi:POU domain%2C class 2, transcription factor 2 isoform X5, partial [Scomber scombrus]